MPNWKKVITSGSSAELNTLKLTGLGNQASEATAVMINGSDVLGTRELGSNAFTSTTIPTNNNQLTNGAGYTTFDGAYSSLTGTPTIPTNNNELSNGAGYITSASIGGTVNSNAVKLSGIEAGATADQSASEILTAIKTVDGASSGLDSDLLDGQHGAYYAPSASMKTYVDQKVAGIVDSAPATLDTLNELAAALNDDANFSASIATTIGNVEASIPTNNNELTNGAGYTTNTGTVTSVGITPGTGLDQSGGPITTSGNITLNLDLTEITLGAGLDSTATGLSLDLSEFTDMTADVVGSEDELILLDNGAERKKAINEIKLSQFNNDSGFITGYTETDTLANVTSRGNTTSGDINVHGNILLTGTATTTNQGRMIDFTGFDKEGTTDFTDRAYIQHTTNTGGHSGTVLLISSENDANDGIAFSTNASSNLKHNSNVIWTAGNDGAGSGLDADTLDGQHASAFLTSYTETDTFATVTSRGSTSNSSITINGLMIGGLGSQTTGGTTDWDHSTNARSGQAHTLLLGTHTNGPGTSNYYHPISFEYSSKNGSGNLTQLAIPYTGYNMFFRSRYSGTWAGWATMWNSENDGAGSGLDADLWDGNQFASYLNQAVLTSSSPSFNQVILTNNGGGTNVRIGDDVWLGDINQANVMSVRGVQNSDAGYISFGNQSSHKLGLNNSSTLTWSSTFSATGDVVAYASSDERLKDNLIPIGNATEKVNQLTGYEFDWNDKQDVYEGHDIGVVAQEVEKVLPELVTTRDNGYKAVKYEKLVALLIQSNKELSARIEKLEKQIK